MRARNPGTFRRARASIARRARAARACAEGCAAIRFRDARARDDVAARRGVRRVGLVGRVFMWILEQRWRGRSGVRGVDAGDVALQEVVGE